MQGTNDASHEWGGPEELGHLPWCTRYMQSDVSNAMLPNRYATEANGSMNRFHISDAKSGKINIHDLECH